MSVIKGTFKNKAGDILYPTTSGDKVTSGNATSGQVLTADGNGNASWSSVPSPSGVEVTTNKVTSLSSSSTDTQYPSAKCVYDMIGDVESLLTAINSGNGV